MLNINNRLCCSAVLIIGLAPGFAFSQSTGQMPAMKKMDDQFAMKAAHGGAAEVAMGKLASEKASDPDVKAYGQKMVDDHSKANDQLMSVGKQESLDLPASMTAKQQAMYNKLNSLSGAAFDKAYVMGMVKDHEEDVADFQKEATSGKDPQIKSFAAETLPVLKEHLSSIKTIQSKMMSGKMSGM